MSVDNGGVDEVLLVLVGEIIWLLAQVAAQLVDQLGRWGLNSGKGGQNRIFGYVFLFGKLVSVQQAQHGLNRIVRIGKHQRL